MEENKFNDIEDADFEEIDDDQAIKQIEAALDELEQDKPTVTLTKHETVKALKDAVEMGQLTPAMAKKMRQQLGIFKTDFTKKKISDSKRKATRQAQKLARKKQRK